MSAFTEDSLEKALLEILDELGYERVEGSKLDESMREGLEDVLLYPILFEKLCQLNKDIPVESIEEAIRKIKYLSSGALLRSNEEFHKMITDGVSVSTFKDKNGIQQSGRSVNIFDFDDWDNNSFLAVDQLSIVGKTKRRTDVVVYINGIPLVLFELKSLSNESVGIKEAYTQVERYKEDISALFVYNAFIVLSDGVNAKAGTISSNEERFMSFRSVDGIDIAPSDSLMLEVLCRGMLAKNRVLGIVKDYTLFMKSREKNVKILAQYHQYFAVKKAIEKTREAMSEDGKIGVIWHTQGSGKSLSMAFYAGQLMRNFNNPTILVVTDRNDLDNQLFETFSKVSDYLRDTPKQVEDKDDLARLLNVNSGGIIFSTIQKFAPKRDSDFVDVLSSRKDIIIIADEAHRSQYGLSAKTEEDGEIKYGYAKYLRDALPNANFIGFTGTPIDFEDKSTIGVFGNYIDTYDMSRAVEDGATVKIYYENRFIKLDLNYDNFNLVDDEFDEIMEGQDQYISEKKKQEITKMEAVIGHPNRMKTLAEDLVNHWETRRDNAFGKAMIVCMSRKICVDLFNEIKSIRPQWYSPLKDKGKMKIIMTSEIAKDPMDWKEHFTTKEDREELANRMRNPDDELEIAIVRDMWLTGFDVPCMHTMYIDKSMKGHNLMQAIARVNRVYKDKSGGLVVDYIGIANDLASALRKYSSSDRNTAGIDNSKAVAVMREYYEKIKEILHAFDYSKFRSHNQLERTRIIIQCMDFILGEDSSAPGTKKNFIDAVAAISKAHSLCITLEEGRELNLEISFFKAVKASLVKLDEERGSTKKLSDAEINKRLARMLSDSIISEEVIDIYEHLGIKNPDLSILSDEFLNEIKEKKEKNLALEMLKKLLEGKIKGQSKSNLVMSQKFSEKLEQAINSYRNKALTSFEIMEELIKIAKEIRTMEEENKESGLSSDEIAFYNAISNYEDVRKFYEEDTLKLIAKELTDTIRKNRKVDWDRKESAQAEMRKQIKRLLKKYDYPPKDIAGAVEVVLKQAKLMCEEMGG